MPVSFTARLSREIISFFKQPNANTASKLQGWLARNLNETNELGTSHKLLKELSTAIQEKPNKQKLDTFKQLEEILNGVILQKISISDATQNQEELDHPALISQIINSQDRYQLAKDLSRLVFPLQAKQASSILHKIYFDGPHFSSDLQQQEAYQKISKELSLHNPLSDSDYALAQSPLHRENMILHWLETEKTPAKLATILLKLAECLELPLKKSA